MHYINKNIAWYRSYKRYTQKEFADMINVSVGQMKTYESTSVPPVENLIKLSEEMQLTIDAIIKVKLTPDNYLLLRKERVKEQTFLDAVNNISTRLDKVEKKLKQKLK